MKITENRYERFAVKIPSVFRSICIMVLVMGLIVTVAVVASGEGLANGILGYLFVIGSILGLRFGGKPEWFVIDRQQNILEVTSYETTFGKADVRRWPLGELVSADLDRSSISTRAVWAIRFMTRSNETILATCYTNQKRKCDSIVHAVKEYMHFA